MRPLTLGAALLLLAATAPVPTPYQVSQRGRAFLPKQLEIHPGESIQVINDDADLVHHAYVDAPNFKYDSGEQEPGSSVMIRFPALGTYQVLCQIHPKMRLTVEVK